MERLRDTVDLSNFAYQNKITSMLTIKTENDAVGIKAKTKHLEYYIYEWEWQQGKWAWDLYNLMNLCFTEKQLINKMELTSILKESRRTRRGGRKMLRRYGINDDAEFTQPWQKAPW